MAHAAQLEFVALLASRLPAYFSNAKVLEIGSLVIDGTVRGFFQDCEYIGIDVAPGRGVDVVCQGQDYQAPDGSFDHVISCECMEHNPRWKETFSNMVRLCRPGGLVTMTCASLGRPEHGTTRTNPGASPLTVGLGWTYYRNLTAADFKGAVDVKRAFSHYRFWTDWDTCDLLFAGVRSGGGNEGHYQGWGSFEQAATGLIEGSKNPTKTRLKQMVGYAFGDSGLALTQRLGRVLKGVR
jgi:SAM-dependent methyltransferase